MMLLTVLIVVAALAIAGTLLGVRRDARGLRPPPSSHRVDTDAVPPAQRLSYR